MRFKATFFGTNAKMDPNATTCTFFLIRTIIFRFVRLVDLEIFPLLVIRQDQREQTELKRNIADEMSPGASSRLVEEGTIRVRPRDQKNKDLDSQKL